MLGHESGDDTILRMLATYPHNESPGYGDLLYFFIMKRIRTTLTMDQRVQYVALYRS